MINKPPNPAMKNTIKYLHHIDKSESCIYINKYVRNIPAVTNRSPIMNAPYVVYEYA